MPQFPKQQQRVPLPKCTPRNACWLEHSKHLKVATFVHVEAFELLTSELPIYVQNSDTVIFPIDQNRPLVMGASSTTTYWRLSSSAVIWVTARLQFSR